MSAFKGWDAQALEALQKRGLTEQDKKRLKHAEQCAVPATEMPEISESRSQQLLIKEFAYRWPAIHATGALFAVPNQAKRGIANASRMKAEGMVKAVSDLILLWPSNGYHGAVIEMKTSKGKATIEQLTWQAERKASGYAAAVCHSVDEAIAFLRGYLNESK